MIREPKWREINRPGLICAALLFFLLFLSTSSRVSAIMVGLSTDEITRSSDAVIRGEVIDETTRWSDDGKLILTRVTLLVSGVIRGEVGSETIIIEHEGGEIGGKGLRVSDSASLKKGEKVLVFIRGTKDKGVFNVVGKAQGKYSVGDGIARKGGFSVMGEQGMIDNNIPVDELIRKIRDVK